jgi:hypothetical protein
LVFDLLPGQSWAFEVAQEQVDRDTPVSRTPIKTRDAGKHDARQRGTPSFSQVQGPHGEVKPLLPTFLYYAAIPREEYKALVIEL